MFLYQTLLTLVLAALSVASPSTLPPLKITTVRGASVGKNVVQTDSRRASSFLKRGLELEAAEWAPMQGRALSTELAASSTPIDDVGTWYTMNVGFGTPAKNFTLLVDVGSSVTWTGTSGGWVNTSSTVDLKEDVFLQYGDGGWVRALMLQDVVTLGPELTVTASVGMQLISTFGNDYDGILGLGPTDLTSNTICIPLVTAEGGPSCSCNSLCSDNSKTIPTVMDNLLAQNKISSEMLGFMFQPTSTATVEVPIENGELTIGGFDQSRIAGNMTFVPLTTQSPASKYFGINLSASYGSTSLLSGAGIVDTGTTLVLLNTSAFNNYLELTGAQVDFFGTGFVEISDANLANLQPLNFLIGGTTFTLSPNAQLWPRSQNTLIGGSPDSNYLMIGNLGGNSANGFTFVLGYAFLERFYSVFDATGKRVGLAPTEFTEALTN